MPDESDSKNRRLVLALNIRNLLYDLNPSTYDKVAPKVEFWIEYALDEHFTEVADLVDRVSCVAWENCGSHSDVSRFLKEFRDAPNRSEQPRTFVNTLCLHVIRWFGVASSEDLGTSWPEGLVSQDGGPGFIRAASFVGHLIKRDLLDPKLVRRHVVKPLTAHYYTDRSDPKGQAVRAHAIYQLFDIAGNTLLQGLLEPEEVQDCFEKLDARASLGKVTPEMDEFDLRELNEFRDIHCEWLLHRKEDRQNTTAPGPVGKIETPDAFVSQDLPAVQPDADGASSSSQTSGPPSTVSSPTLSASTPSDSTPTGLDEEIVKGSNKQEPTVVRHKAFYLEDGNVEILCGNTCFRVHSQIVSFSSSTLRNILSKSTLEATTPEGCPRVVFEDSPDDFVILLKMIYTPGFPSWRKVPKFSVFASLLRMATKYGFSEVREQLVHILKGAYPTKWETYQTTNPLGEEVFGLPEPHPNAVLNLFLEQNIRFAIPLAAYGAAIGGFSTLLSDGPGTAIPRLALASTIYGMDTIQGEVSRLAHSIVCSMGMRDCYEAGCIVNGGNSSPDQRMEILNVIYDALVKQGKGDVFSLSLGDIVCAGCAAGPEQTYRVWCATIWEEFPRIFGVGESWEEV